MLSLSTPFCAGDWGGVSNPHQGSSSLYEMAAGFCLVRFISYTALRSFFISTHTMCMHIVSRESTSLLTNETMCREQGDYVMLSKDLVEKKGKTEKWQCLAFCAGLWLYWTSSWEEHVQHRGFLPLVNWWKRVKIVININFSPGREKPYSHSWPQEEMMLFWSWFIWFRGNMLPGLNITWGNFRLSSRGDIDAPLI